MNQAARDRAKHVVVWHVVSEVDPSIGVCGAKLSDERTPIEKVDAYLRCDRRGCRKMWRLK